MIFYALISFLLILYFEFLGQYITIKAKINDFVSSFAFGFFAFLAVTYVTTSFFTGTGSLVLPVFLFYTLLLLVGFVLICSKIREIIKKFNVYTFLIIILFSAVLCFYSYETTLGNIYGFDTEFYAGMVSTNSISIKFNEFMPSYGGRKYYVPYQYSFQTYYFFVSYLLKVLRPLSNIINIGFNNLSFFTWVFQIISNYLLISLIMNTINLFTKRKRVFNFFIIIVLVFFYGKWYFNNVFGFYGNTLKTYAFSYMALILLNYRKLEKASLKILISICILSGCAFSSSSIFIGILALFGYFFAFVDEDDGVLKFVSLVSLVPLINLFSQQLYDAKKALVISFTICLIIYLLNNLITQIFRKKKVKYGFLILAILIMIIMSYRVTGNIFDFSAFYNNLGSDSDMALNYLGIFGTGQANVYCLLIDIAFIYYIIKNKSEKISIVCWVLIVTLLNPLCCSFINSINPVYYRTYDIFLNPCTFIVFSYSLFDLIKSKYFYSFLLIVLSLFFIFRSNIFKPLYYHESFIPEEDYNGELRMTNSEYDIIDFIKKDAEYKKIDVPYILNSNLLTQSLIPNGEFVFSRSKDPWNISGDDLRLFYMFYPVNKLGEEERPGVPRWDKLGSSLKRTRIEYIVVDKELECYVEENKQYEYLYHVIQKYDYSDIYENEGYLVVVY